jgi:uncharacterized protein
VESPQHPSDEPPSTRPHPVEHGSSAVRALLLIAGGIAFLVGMVGIFLPLLPATPPLILAAACFARAHRPFHQWMLGNQLIGPLLREWHTHRSIPYRTKMVAIVTMLVSFGSSIVLVVKALLAVFAVGLAAWMYRIPSRDQDPRS